MKLVDSTSRVITDNKKRVHTFREDGPSTFVWYTMVSFSLAPKRLYYIHNERGVFLCSPTHGHLKKGRKMGGLSSRISLHCYGGGLNPRLPCRCDDTPLVQE